MFNPSARHTWDAPATPNEPREGTMDAEGVTAILDRKPPASDDAVANAPTRGGIIYTHPGRLVAALLLLLAVPVGIGISHWGFGSSTPERPTFEASLVYCYGAVPANSLSEDGKTMAVRIEIDGNRDPVTCLLDRLHFPDSLWATKIGKTSMVTSMMDGQQSATADGFKVAWTFDLDGAHFLFTDSATG